MASKRKFSDTDLSDDDEPSMGKQVLPVANLPLNFDGTPEDGLQYLFTVRRDARSLPHITRVANPYEVKEETSDVAPKVEDFSGSYPGLPSEKWRDLFLKRFRNFRKNSVQPTIHVPTNRLDQYHKVMPDKKERDHWWAFVAGRSSFEWDPPKKPKALKSNRFNRGGNERYSGGMRGYQDVPTDGGLYYEQRAFSTAPHEAWLVNTDRVENASSSDAATSLPTPSGTPAPPDLRQDSIQDPARCSESKSDASAAKPRELTPALLQHIDHRYALHLLMYFTHWINVQFEADTPLPLPEAYGRWIFILLSRVDDYVTADEMSLLRNLARACMSVIEQSKRRASASAAEEDAPTASPSMDEGSCWMAITAVVGIWGQRDLWQDAEDMLRKA